MLGLIILFVISRTIDIRESLEHLKGANLFYLFLCGALLNIDRFFMAFKWGLLIKNRGNIPFLPLVKSYYLSSAMSSIVPPTVGEDIVRGISVTKDGLDKECVLSSIFAERLLGTLSMFLLSSLTLFMLSWYHPETNLILFYTAVGLLVLMALIILLTLYIPFELLIKWFPFLRTSGRLVSLIKESYMTYQSYGHAKALVFLFIFLSVIENCFVVLGIYWIGLAIGTEVRFVDMLLTVPAITLFSKIPITFGSIGVQEGIFVKLLATVGVLPSQAFTISILGRLVNIVAVLPVLICLYIWGNGKKNRRQIRGVNK